ncbi:LysR family transcriptional regulator [Rhizobiales bacterium]|uniref:LysR family transcriptional regulator n=1 Tax=Hongsoonwoonella zoysiae TaxID=2821844 RepID=UPI001560E642|nr:LysR family transcriptional regulator [Hongsoonwoonella zoysiae]NRG17350.1 LysR family transcriptional regulator [Hongsoonwoonella zoysiae]
MNQHLSMSVFVAVARAGSFSEAARKLAMSTTAVSRHVAELEAKLGVTLLRRSTRHISMTEAGEAYLPRAASILEEIDTLNGEIRAAGNQPRGRLRITAPPGIGGDWIAPLALDFVEAHPNIDLELDLSERLVNLVAEGFDAAIRSGELADSSMIAHHIVDIAFVPVASPDYLARKGVPERPEDLIDHDSVHWLDPFRPNEWTFACNGGWVTVPIRPRLGVTDLATHRAAALRGMGITLLPDITLVEDFRAGRLVRVLPDCESLPSTLSLVRPNTPFEPPKLRVFIDFITKALRERAKAT